MSNHAIGVVIHGLCELVGLLGGPISCCTCNTLVKSTEGRVRGDTTVWNLVYILSSAYIDAIVHL